MEIFYNDIPEEGLPVTGEIEPARFQLADEDCIRVTSPITFDLTLYKFDEAVVLSGRVGGRFDLQCVTCLDYFSYQAEFDSWQSDVDIEEGERAFDPRDSLRDEILLALPHSPHCDEQGQNSTCPKAELLERFEHDEMPLETEPPSADESGDDDDVWGALDQLQPEQ